mgnify:FL=1
MHIYVDLLHFFLCLIPFDVQNVTKAGVASSAVPNCRGNARKMPLVAYRYVAWSYQPVSQSVILMLRILRSKRTCKCVTFQSLT